MQTQSCLITEGWQRSFLQRMILSISLMFLLAACGSRVELLSNLPENEANEVVGALLNAAIHVTKKPGKEGTITLEIEQESVAQAISVLDSLGLPRHRRSKMGDIFKKENLISSSLEERARYLYGLSQELEQTISQIDGVVTARVHVVLPERLGPGDANMPSSASVFIKHQEGYGVENVVNEVRAIVANSVAGLSNEKVAVALFPSKSVGKPTPLQWTEVLFFQVLETSATALRIMLGVMALISVLGIAAMIYLAAESGLFSAMKSRAMATSLGRRAGSPRGGNE